MLQGAPLTNVLNWIEINTPLTMDALAGIAHKSYADVTLGISSHIEPKFLPLLLAYAKRGVRMVIAPCVPGIADHKSFAHLAEHGIRTVGIDAQTWPEIEAAWDEVLAAKPRYLFDIGGGLIKRAVEAGAPIRAACEATSTGIDLVKTLAPNFPIFNWNDVPVKNLMHNRYEVGSGVWYGFRSLTGLDLCRMRVGVVGFGLVGQSVASIARGLGAQAFVAETDSIRNLTAASEGYVTMTLEDLVARVDVVVSATGAQRTLHKTLLARAKSGLIVANAGHDSRDIDTSAMGNPNQVMPGVAEFDLDGVKVFVLCEGRLLNLAAGGGSAVNTFDLSLALIANLIDFVLTDGRSYAPGLHDLPASVSKHFVDRASARQRSR